MSPLGARVSGLIEKLSSKDKDLRYMAVSDLFNELKAEGISCGMGVESKLCESILKVTEDPSSDVCTLAIKCLCPLLGSVSDGNSRELVRRLCHMQQNPKGSTTSSTTSLTSKKAMFRSISLKTLIADVKRGENKSSKVLVEEALPRMLHVLKTVKESESLGESLDIVTELVKKFGFYQWRDQADLTNSLLEIFSTTTSSDAFVRKKCISCVSALAVHLEGELLERVLRTCVDALSQVPLGGGVDTLSRTQLVLLKSQVTCVGSLVASVGARQGQLLSQTIPTLVSFCAQAESEQEDCDEVEAICELREACINCFEAFVNHVKGFDSSCSDHVSTFVSLCVKYACYDPNFAYDDDMEVDDEDDDMDTGDNEDDDEDDYGGSDYDDDEDYDEGEDDDSSWKVRKAALHCLISMVQTYSNLMLPLLEASLTTLVGRLKERDEGVKAEILAAIQSFLVKLTEEANSLDAATRGRCFSIVSDKVPSLMKHILKELVGKSTSSKIKLCYIKLLMVAVGTPGVSLLPYASDLLKQVQGLINEGSLETNIKVEAFLLLQGLFHLSEENAYNTKTLKELLSTLLAAAEEKSFKVSAMAFRTLFKALEMVNKKWDSVYENVVVDIYDMAFSQMTSSDIDLEVREEAIKCMGLLLSLFPSHLPGRSDKALEALFDRTGSEGTRVIAVKTLAKIASSGQVAMSCISGKLELQLATYLKKADHNLRVSALSALSTLVETGQLSGDITSVVENSSNLICDADIPLASTAIYMLCKLMNSHKNCRQLVETFAKPMVLALIKSPLVQGSLVEPLQAFFSKLSASLTAKKVADLLSTIEELGLEQKAKQNVRKAAAKCIASVCQASKGKGTNSVDYANKSIDLISKGKVADQGVVLSLLCLAEIGRLTDLSGCNGIESVILDCFQASSEDVRGIASYALGSVCSQNLDHFLPMIFSHMESHSKLKYLLLLSLKEVLIASQAMGEQSNLKEEHFTSLQKVLFHSCETEEEAIRIICAECQGHMALINPALMIPSLAEHLESDNPSWREVCVSAFRDAANSSQLSTEGKGVFQPFLESFLHKISDPDLKVQKAAILLLNVLLHNHLDSTRPLLPATFPMLYKCTEFSKESLREVQLGPFKQIVDDYLVVRRTAYECMHTAVNKCFDIIQPEADHFVDLVISGATDHYDTSKTSHLTLSDHYSMKMTCFGILSRLGEVHPKGCMAKASLILPPLYKTLIQKLKSDAVKQELERLEEVQNACMRCVKNLSTIVGMQETEMFGKLMISFNKNEELLKKYKA